MKVKLTNMMNGESAYCEMRVPAYSAIYAEHGDILKWARKTGCARLLRKTWDGENTDCFISAEVEGETTCGIALYTNPREDGFYRSYVSYDDRLAFWIEEDVREKDEEGRDAA